jgi:hypothetical protein
MGASSHEEASQKQKLEIGFDSIKPACGPTRRGTDGGNKKSAGEPGALED